jgi:hypothetical protein
VVLKRQHLNLQPQRPGRELDQRQHRLASRDEIQHEAGYAPAPRLAPDAFIGLGAKATVWKGDYSSSQTVSKVGFR